MALAKNSSILLSRMKQTDRSVLAGTGRVLFADDFDDGFDGWRDHYDSVNPAPALSRSDLASVTGGRSLMVPVHGYPAGMSSSTYLGAYNPSAFKNLTRFLGETRVDFSAFVAVGGQSSAALGGFFLSIDTQTFAPDDSATRSFFKLRCQRTNSGYGVRQWQIASSNTPSTQWVDVPGATESVTAGDNENKFNFNYVRLSVDLSANDGLGGYVEAQINNTVFDLTALGDHAEETPQRGQPIDSFSGGLNFGFTAYTGGADTGNGFILVDQVAAEVHAS